jgi:tetratricopeptide (TPR) repeat protein
LTPLVLALICSSVAGDKLAKAKAQAAALEYATALRAAREALEAGDANPDETAAIHAFTGELAAALGDRDLARAEFSRALTLNPKLELPGASPRIRDALADARKRVSGAGLDVEAKSTRAADGSVSTVVSWTGDAFSLAAAARVYVEFNGTWVPVPDPKKWTCLEPCRWWAAAVDAHGNQLARAGRPDEPFVVPPLANVAVAQEPAAAPVAMVTTRPWYQRAGPYFTALAVVSAGLAAYFGATFAANQQRLLQVEANRSQHYLSEAVALDASRKLNYGFMFGAIGLSVVAAAVAVFTW